MDLFGPLVTADGVVSDPARIAAVVIAAVVIGVLGVVFRKALMAAADELAQLWREYGPIASRKALERRTMPATPWFCARCRSRNGVAAKHCYACGALREQAELEVPGAELPAGPSAGLSGRTRRHG